MGWLDALGESVFGKEEKNYQQSTLNKGQRGLHKQYLQALQSPGTGGAFGTTADYYRDLLSDNPQDLQAFAAPQQRQFNEETIPGLSEQFAGMGSGGLSSSGFRNAAVSAGTDLNERLGAMRAQLRQSGAQGLQSLAQGAFNPVQENIVRPATGGLLQGLASGAGQGLAAYATGGMGGGGVASSAQQGNKNIQLMNQANNTRG
jgi:hypothetical protein